MYMCILFTVALLGKNDDDDNDDDDDDEQPHWNACP